MRTVRRRFTLGRFTYEPGESLWAHLGTETDWLEATGRITRADGTDDDTHSRCLVTDEEGMQMIHRQGCADAAAWTRELA